MTVLCTNSGITYADIASAIAGESGNVYLDRKEYIQSGMSTAAANFTPVDHPLGFLYTAADGELVTSGDINSGAGTNSAITSTVDGGEITGVRTGALNVLSSNNAKLRRVIVNAGNGSTDGIAFNDTLDAEDVLIHNCNDGFLSSTVRLNSSIVRCTVVGATRFGFAQGKFTDCVDVNSSNQGYFNEAAGSSGTWENDGTGTDTITESPATDIFVDYAGGDYSIKADSSPGLSGAGAFIAETPSGGVTGDIELNVGEVGFSASGSVTLPQPNGAINFSINEIEFAISASATLPNPSGDIGFDLSQIEFISTGGATLPQPVGEIDFDLLSIDFSGIGSATIPFPVGAASFDIALIEFNGAGSSTQPSPSGGVEFDISSIEFIGSGSASLPFPVGSASFEVAQVEFSGTGQATFPQPSGNADFRVDEVGFYATGSATQPDSVGNIAFDIASIEFSAIGSVTGVTLPFGDVILPAYTSNVIILNTPPNLIKL